MDPNPKPLNPLDLLHRDGSFSLEDWEAVHGRRTCDVCGAPVPGTATRGAPKKRCAPCAPLAADVHTKVNAVKTRAWKEGVPFTLRTDDILRAAREQGWKCARTGIPFARTGGMSPWRLAIDRKDKTQGYTPDNIQLVVWAYEVIKQDGCGGSDEEAVRTASKLADGLRRTACRAVKKSP